MGRLHVRVQPGARRTALAGWFGDHPKIAVAAPPVDGAANEVLVDWLARFFDKRPRDVRIVGGAGSRTKRIEVEGIDDVDLLARIEAANPRPER
jgi:uncharacterized protein (TIGR00251 family)